MYLSLKRSLLNDNSHVKLYVVQLKKTWMSEEHKFYCNSSIKTSNILHLVNSTNINGNCDATSERNLIVKGRCLLPNTPSQAPGHTLPESRWVSRRWCKPIPISHSHDEFNQIRSKFWILNQDFMTKVLNLVCHRIEICFMADILIRVYLHKAKLPVQNY